MEAQTPRNGILAGSLGNESSESVKSNDPLHRRYTVMMQICAATNTKEDISRAMSIAFEVTERMIRGNMKLNSKTFTEGNVIKTSPTDIRIWIVAD